MDSAITINLYDDNDEVIGTFSRTHVKWNMFKKALSLQNLGSNMSEDDFDKISKFICEFFGNKFTVDQLNDGADASEIFALFQSIFTRATSIMASQGMIPPNAAAGK